MRSSNAARASTFIGPCSARFSIDGTFSIDLLPAGHLRLHIEHPAYPPADVDVVASSDNQARTRLRLALGGGVEGALLDAASGAPIPSVTLTASGPASSLAEASTDKAGRWKLGPLKPGRWKIAIKQPGYLAQTRELDVPVAHAPGGTSVRDIRVEGGAGGAGTLRLSGTYGLCNLRASRRARIVFTGPSELLVAGAEPARTSDDQ
jgi:hypothetical protein